VQLGTAFAALLRYNHDGNLSSFVNANPTPVSVASTGVSISGGDGLGINANPAGGVDNANAIHRIRVWEGNGIADIWTDARCHAYLMAILGLTSRTGPAATFARASMAAHHDAAGRLHLASLHMPRTGDAGGARLESAQENKARRNVDPANGNIWTVDDASAVTAVDDSAALAVALIESASTGGGLVYEYANATGASRYIYDADASVEVGNLNAHSLSVYARILAGAGAQLGWWDKSLASFTSAGAIVDAYARTELENLTPADTDEVLAIHIPDGCTLRWIGHQCEERWHCSTLIPVWSIVGTETRADDDLDLGQDALDNGGSVEVVAAPLGWGGNPVVQQSMVSVGAANLVTVETDSDVRIDDGTTTVDAAGTTFVDGTDVRVRGSWSPDADQYIYSDGNVAVGAYDGALPAGTIALGLAGSPFAWAVKRISVLRRFQTGGVT